MAERLEPKIYSIAAHRGFADALVAGLAPRHEDSDLGFARLTLILPSARAMRTVSEAFIRYYGAQDRQGLLMPRMVAVGDLDLDESLGPLLDPLGSGDIPPPADPTFRWLRLAQLLAKHWDGEVASQSTLLRLARDAANTMDRLLAEEVPPERLFDPEIVSLDEDQAAHWQVSLRLFAKVQAEWLIELGERKEVDAATRRNLLFDLAAETWRSDPPEHAIVAAGVTSAAPALARLLKVIAFLPEGAVVLPDFDLTMADEVWNELGRAGQTDRPGETIFGRGDAVTHPQYHLKLLLNRMDIARDEVRQWHRKGMDASPPERSHAISSLFLPPKASKRWIDLSADKRRLAGVRIMETATPEEEAQAVALLVRQALSEKEKRVAIVTPDRGLAQRIAHHLRRWNIEADDSAGLPLSQSPAGRLLLLLAELAAGEMPPVELIALLEHPLVKAGEERRSWLRSVRKFDLQLRGPRPSPGIEPLREVAREAKQSEWWEQVETALSPIWSDDTTAPLADWIDRLASAAESLCGDAIWSREDGRGLASFVEDLRVQATATGTALDTANLPIVLRDAMENIAVRPPYVGHPRVAIYGLLEARMTRAHLVICAGLNEGTWPATPAIDPLLAPAILRSLGVPGADFRIGLSAHDLAGALGAPEVVLSRAARDIDGPAIPSRFLLRVKALLGEELLKRHTEDEAVMLARAIDFAESDTNEAYPRPMPSPSPEQRLVDIAVTALDRLRGDPYQFYAQSILGLRSLDALDAEPSAAWQGTVAHDILQKWHEDGGSLRDCARQVLEAHNAHPLMEGLWLPRLLAGLDAIEAMIEEQPDRSPIAIEEKGAMQFDGVRVHGRADRIDRLADGSVAVVDYKTGHPPSSEMVRLGYALQLGLIGLIAEDGGIKDVSGHVTAFEYWSLAKKGDSFGYVATPVKQGRNRSKIEPDEFLPLTERFLREAIADYIKGSKPFTAKLNPDYPGYSDYDQLMRLEEWQAQMGEGDDA